MGKSTMGQVRPAILMFKPTDGDYLSNGVDQRQLIDMTYLY